MIVRNELNSPRLKWLSEDEVFNALIDIFKEIKVLTGAIMAEGDDLKIQLRVLNLFLLSHDKFTNLTTNEIRQAFYLNSQGVYDEVHKHYNKKLNAEFVGNVLLSYLKYKKEFYRTHGGELRKLMAPKQISRAVMNERDYRAVIQMHYDYYCEGNTDLIYVSTITYNLLRRYGAIKVHSRQHWRQLIEQAICERERYGNRGLVGKDIGERDRIQRVKEIYKRYRKEWWIPRNEWAMVVHTLRRRQYLVFFETMRYYGIRNIFTEITCTQHCK